MDTQIQAQRVIHKGKIDIVVHSGLPGGKRSVGLPIQMITIGEHEVIPEPTLSITPEEGQQLMDELWGCGLRPTEGVGSIGALAATERHLRDLQRLVFKDKT